MYINSISGLLKLHDVLDDMFFEHQKALLHYDFEKAFGSLLIYESTLLRHMVDEEQVLLPEYAGRVQFQGAGNPKHFFDDHEKMRSFVVVFQEKTAELKHEPDVDKALLKLLDREAFFLRLCSHHDKRENDFLYPILEDLLLEDEKVELLDRIDLRGAPNSIPAGLVN